MCIQLDYQRAVGPEQVHSGAGDVPQLVRDLIKTGGVFRCDELKQWS